MWVLLGNASLPDAKVQQVGLEGIERVEGIEWVEGLEWGRWCKRIVQLTRCKCQTDGGRGG